MFVTNLGPLPTLIPGGLDLKGTVAYIHVSTYTYGKLPPFVGPDYEYHVLTYLTNLSLLIASLKQGFFCISATNTLRSILYMMPQPPIINLCESHLLLPLKLTL